MPAAPARDLLEAALAAQRTLERTPARPAETSDPGQASHNPTAAAAPPTRPATPPN